jgi:hypothetical protein
LSIPRRLNVRAAPFFLDRPFFVVKILNLFKEQIMALDFQFNIVTDPKIIEEGMIAGLLVIAPGNGVG